MGTKKGLVSYVFFVLAVLSLVAYTLNWIDETIMMTLLGLFGFNGVAALRAYIESKGWKTYSVAIAGVLGSLGVAFGVLSPDAAAVWFGFFGVISGATLTHAVQKANQ